MNFDISGVLKIFGSIYRLSFIVFMFGLFVFFSSEEMKDKLFINDLVSTYGIYIGIATIVSGILIILFIFEKTFIFIRTSKESTKHRKEAIKILRNLSVDEKGVLVQFLAGKTQTLSFGTRIELYEQPPIGMLMAKGLLDKSNIGLTAYYHIDDLIWELIQNNQQEIFYEDTFWSKEENQ